MALLATSCLAQTEQKSPDVLRSFAESLTSVPANPGSETGRSYVPVYSSVMAGGGKTKVDFAVTLSIHNTSERDPLIISRIDYHDTSGALTQAYLNEPIAVRPFGTIQIVVAQEDMRGGLGANFIVDWQNRNPGTQPAVEAVMIANIGTQSFSFLSTARRVAR
jgi:hypothetical protein